MSQRQRHRADVRHGESHIGGPRRLRLGARMRAYFFAGILITAPMAFTLYLAWLLLNFVDTTVQGILPERFNPDAYLPFSLPGIGVVIIVLGLILVGWLTAGFVGRLFLRISESVLARIPGVSTIYSATKQILETVLANQSAAFREAVLIEYPRRGIWCIGFITATTSGEVARQVGEDMVNVFLPTTPNPTSGFLLFVPRRDVKVLGMTVESAVKLVMSAGIVSVPDRDSDAEDAAGQVAGPGKDGPYVVEGPKDGQARAGTAAD